MMKKILSILFIATLFACNNESTDTSRSDSTVIEKDNTINADTGIYNRDTGINKLDSANRRDSLR